VGAERHARRARHPAQDGAEERADFVRRGVAHRIRKIDRRTPGRDHRFDDATEELEIAPRRILRRKLHIVGIAPGLPNRRNGRVEACLSRDPQLALQVEIGGRNERMDTPTLGGRQRAARAVDIDRMTPRQRGDHRTLDVGRHPSDSFVIGLRRNRKPSLDHVRPQHRELPRHLHLFVGAQRKTWRLLAIAERRVEDRQTVGHV
jgi:hypothetical protein